MGYDVHFSGHLTIEPPLNVHEARYLRQFARSRRFHRVSGPYRTDTDQLRGADTVDYNGVSPEQPGLNCHWKPTDDAAGIEWDGQENVRQPVEWMRYLIATFLDAGATLRAELADPVPGRHYPPEFAYFTFDHVVSGIIEAHGEYRHDRWRLIVEDNEVRAEDLYCTHVTARLTVEPPLNADEVAHLYRLARNPDLPDVLGPYRPVATAQLLSAALDGGSPSYPRPDPDDSHQYTDDPAVAEWTGRTVDWWMRNLIDTFRAGDTIGRVVIGVVEVQGDDPADRWRLVIDDNLVSVELISTDRDGVQPWDGMVRILW
jgi:hypothetical protein